MDNPTCETCKFFRGPYVGEHPPVGHGVCDRFPPSGQPQAGEFSMPMARQRCGEHTIKEQPNARPK